MLHARRILDTWQADYNSCRPHTSLGGRTPNEFLPNNPPDLKPTPATPLSFAEPSLLQAPPIEQLFAKLKHELRKADKRTFNAVSDAIASVLETITLQKYSNYLANSEYNQAETHRDLGGVDPGLWHAGRLGGGRPRSYRGTPRCFNSEIFFNA